MSARDQTPHAAASDWLLRLQSDDLDPQELAAWLEWYGADPANAQAFEESQARYDSLRAVPLQQRQTLAESLMEPDHAAARGSLRRTNISSTPGYFALAASVAVAALGIGVWIVAARGPIQASHTAVYQTPRATHRNYVLPDGTNIKLGASSSVSLNFTDEGRYLVLESGEAFFEVARDSRRPFTVQAGAVTVHALGTAFNVRRAPEHVFVAVSEGAVEVGQRKSGAEKPVRTKSAVRVSAGEQISVNPASQAMAMAAADPQAIAAWRKGRLEFVNEPLSSVIATVNRYSSREIVVTDRQLAAISYTGTVNEERIEEWLNALPKAFPLQVSQVGGETVLLSMQR